jgi:hypothetical protein
MIDSAYGGVSTMKKANCEVTNASGLWLLLLAFILIKSLIVTAVSDATPVAIWLLDEGTGAVAKDTSGNGHDGEIRGGSKWIEGKINQAIEFDGSSGYIFVADHPDFALTKNMTVALWVKVNAPGPQQQIFFRGDNRGGLDPYWIGVTSDSIKFLIEGNGQATLVAKYPGLKEWFHLAAVLDDADGTINIYFDGELAASQKTTVRPFADLIAAQQPGLGIGSLQTGGGQFLSGDVDEILVDDDALTPAKLKKIMKGITADVNPMGKLFITWGDIKSNY